MASGTNQVPFEPRCYLEGWREIILRIHPIVTWENKLYPVGIWVAVTVLFLIMKHFHPTVITSVAVLGIIICLLDYLGPKLHERLFNEQDWTAEKELKFQAICISCREALAQFTAICYCIRDAKQTKPTLYFFVVLIMLILLAIVGHIFSGLFVTYLLVCFFVMLPGLYRTGLMDRIPVCKRD